MERLPPLQGVLLLAALSLLFVKSKTAHSASSEVIIQQMWILRKSQPFCLHFCKGFSLLQYQAKRVHSFLRSC